MTTVFYRFRSTDALLGTFQELENQEIFFASPKDLNDPMEGFKNLFWRGDEILWSNLLRHYLMCLMHTVTVALLTKPDQALAEDEGFVFWTAEALPTPQLRDLYRRICDIFFQHDDIAQLSALLATRRSPTRRNELTAYFRAFHLRALDAVLTAMGERQMIPPRLGNDPLHAACASSSSCKDMVQALDAAELQHLHRTDIAEVVCAAFDVTAMQLDLIDQYKGVSPERRPALRAIISEFPRRHVTHLEELLYADWYAACFVECPMHAAMWGNYGDGHKGVCLKFKAYPDAHGKPAIKLRRISGWHYDEDGSTPNYGYVEHEFTRVEYEARFVDIDFFRSLRLSRSKLNYWYKDAAGHTSPLVGDILAESASWRDQYWKNSARAMTTKLTDWAHEKEHRLTIDDSLFNFTEPSSRKLQYHFEDLAGLIFGIKTSTADKLEIMRIVEDKCRKAGRNDFEFHQAYYSPSTGKMEMPRMSLLKFT